MFTESHIPIIIRELKMLINISIIKLLYSFTI